jgi:hypothetical protein
VSEVAKVPVLALISLQGPPVTCGCSPLFDTPQAKDKLAELERFEAEVRAEIEAAEAARAAAAAPTKHDEL